MKKLVIVCVALLGYCVSYAQTQGVEFFHGTLDEAVAKAKTEGKRVFVDFYTEWCGPCKAVANKVFPSDTAGLYFNANFINIKVDAEKGDGVELSKSFNVEGFPTFLVLNPDKTIQARWMGASMNPTPAGFIEIVRKKMGGGVPQTAL